MNRPIGLACLLAKGSHHGNVVGGDAAAIGLCGREQRLDQLGHLCDRPGEGFKVPCAPK